MNLTTLNMDCQSSLQDYLTNAKLILSKFETKLGWEPPIVQKETELIVCPVDGGHRIQRAKSGSHTSSCRWRKLGYSRKNIREILDQEERTKAQNDPVIINSDSIISDIAPSAGLIRSDELYKATLNPSQRLAVYEAEVLQCYSSEKSLPDKALYADLEAKAAEKLYQQENPENLSQVELLQKLRDMKRRRQSYRAKNVHITKRSQTEILRGVLKVHMEELEKMWNPKQQELGDNCLIEGHERKRGHSFDRKSSCSRQPPDSQRMHQEESKRKTARLSRESFGDYRKDDKSTLSKNAERSLISKHHKMGDSGMSGRDGLAGDARKSTKDLSRMDNRTYSRKGLEPSKADSISKEKLYSFSTVSRLNRSRSSNSDEDDHKKHKQKKKKSKKQRRYKKEK